METKSFNIWYKVLLQKAYLDKGWNLTAYPKYAIVLFGVASENLFWTLLIGFIYLICCYILGLCWYKYKIIEVEYEIRNRFDRFIKEMRIKIK